MTTADTEQFRVQAASSGNFIDCLQGQGLSIRYGNTGSTTAMAISGTTGNVACTNDIAAQDNQIRLTANGTGGNKRGVIQLVPPNTIDDAQNVFYVTPSGGGGNTCTISKAAQYLQLLTTSKLFLLCHEYSRHR